MNKKYSFIQKIHAYKLEPQIAVVGIVIVIFFVSFFLYHIPYLSNNEVASNLLLAIFTSLLVTVFTMVADIVVSYRSHQNETFFEDMHEFGIGSLNGDKETALREHLKECDKVIWISGYRLIMTEHLKNEIHDDILRGAPVYAVICPPWTDAFKMVYGTNEKVMDYYFKVFGSMLSAKNDAHRKDDELEIHFLNKPIFSDTYRVDQHLITGPYMHNKDPEFKKMMAKDFFSYNVVRESSLYQIINEEFLMLFSDESQWQLDWTKFEKAYKKYDDEDLNDKEKIDLFRDSCCEMPVSCSSETPNQSPTPPI